MPLNVLYIGVLFLLWIPIWPWTLGCKHVASQHPRSCPLCLVSESPFYSLKSVPGTSVAVGTPLGWVLLNIWVLILWKHKTLLNDRPPLVFILCDYLITQLKEEQSPVNRTEAAATWTPVKVPSVGKRVIVTLLSETDYAIRLHFSEKYIPCRSEGQNNTFWLKQSFSELQIVNCAYFKIFQPCILLI